MTPTKLLLGQIFVVFAIVIGAVWGATQWAAGQLGYQPGLGPAWITLKDYPIYPPWRLFEWWYAYEAYAPGVFNRAGAMAAGGGIAMIRAALKATRASIVIALVISPVSGLEPVPWCAARQHLHDRAPAGQCRFTGLSTGMGEHLFLRL